MTQNWRIQEGTSWVRSAAAGIAAALFLGGLAFFLLTLLRPFEDPRLLLLTCDGDPATAGASPLELLAAENPRGSFCRSVTSPPGPEWLRAIAELGDRVRRRDTVLIYLRGAWCDSPEPTFRPSHLMTGSASSETLDMDTILSQIEKLPAAKVILCLDDSDPELDQFSERLKQSVGQDSSNRVVIITAHMLGEESFPLPGRRCTAFGQVLARALGATADRDGDALISLKEFLAAVEQHVDGWAAELTGGRESQTPMIINAERLRPQSILCPVLQTVPDTQALAGEGATESEDSEGTLFDQLVSTWQLAEQMISRGIESEMPLVICRGLQRDLHELERRWRFGESSADLKRAMESLRTTLAALDSGSPLPPGGPRWAQDLARLKDAPVRAEAPMAANVEALISLQKMISEGATKEAVDQWLSESDCPVRSRTWQLVEKLTRDADIPSSLWRDVLLTRLNLELVPETNAAMVWSSSGRAAAERAALRSERLLLDRIETNWEQRARQANRTANSAIEKLVVIDRLHARSHRVTRRAILTFPDFLDADVRLQFWENDPSEMGNILDGMLETLALLRKALQSETLDDPGQVERLVQALESDQGRLLQPVHLITAQATTPDSLPPAIEIARLLRTNLLSLEDRVGLLTAWQSAAARLPLEAPRPTSAGKVIVRGLGAGLARNCERRVRFQHLFMDSAGLDAAAATVAAADADQNLLDALQQFESNMDQVRMQQPGKLRQQVIRFLAAPVDQQTCLHGRHLWHSLDGLDDDSQLPVAWPRLAERLRLCRNVRCLDQRIHLVQLACNDAAEWERVCYEQREADIRAARSYFEQWPSPPHHSSPVLRGPELVTLGDESASELEFQIENPPAAAGPIHLTVQYDAEQYTVSTPDGRQLLPAQMPPWPYAEGSSDVGYRIQSGSAGARRVTLLVRPNSIDTNPGRLLVRLRGSNWTARVMCQLLPPRKLPFELVLRDVLGTVVQNERGFSVEPYPNRSASLQWLLRNRSAAIQHARLSIYTLDGSATELPRYAIPTDTVDDVLRTLRQPVLAVEVPAIELDPHPEPQFVSFPKAEGETVPLSMQGGLLVALTDDATGLTQLHQIRFHPQRPLRFVETNIDYERANGRITVQVKARDGSRLPREGLPVSVRLADSAPGPRAARSSAVLTPSSPQTSLILVADPEADHRVELDVAGWPRAFLFNVIDGEASLDENSSIRVTSPVPGQVYQMVEAIPIHVEIDGPPAGFSAEGDFFEVGVDANHDRRLDGETTVRLTRDRNALIRWLGAGPDGSTQFDVSIGDFELMLPVDGLRDQRANLLSKVVLSGKPEAWGDPVPLVFDSAAPTLSSLEVQPGPTVVIGQPMVVITKADDAGLSGVSLVEVSFDPTRTGTFDAKAKPVEAVPLEDGRWRAEAPTDKLEQGRHLLVARAVDQAGNAESPHLLWVEAITPEEAAHRQSERTTPVTGQLFYGTEPVSGFKVRLTADQTEGADASDPMNMKKSSQPEKSFAATSGNDGTFLMPAVTGGQYTLHIEGTLRGVTFDRQRKLTVDVDNPPSPITVRLDRPPETPDE